jgi:hypothetical protein
MEGEDYYRLEEGTQPMDGWFTVHLRSKPLDGEVVVEV